MSLSSLGLSTIDLLIRFLFSNALPVEMLLRMLVVSSAMSSKGSRRPILIDKDLPGISTELYVMPSDSSNFSLFFLKVKKEI